MKMRRIDQILVKVSGQTNDLTANSADPFGQFSKFLKYLKNELTFVLQMKERHHVINPNLT